MPSIPSLVKQLRRDYPDITFEAGTVHTWSPLDHTVVFTTADASSLLHEVAHALLDHHNYSRDITLLQMERDAWEYARTHLGPRYNVPISPDTINQSLDSYREWLHARSTCPECKATGVEIDQKTYRCLDCHTLWYVNEARTCRLKRTRAVPQ